MPGIYAEYEESRRPKRTGIYAEYEAGRAREAASPETGGTDAGMTRQPRAAASPAPAFPLPVPLPLSRGLPSTFERKPETPVDEFSTRFEAGQGFSHAPADFSSSRYPEGLKGDWREDLGAATGRVLIRGGSPMVDAWLAVPNAALAAKGFVRRELETVPGLDLSTVPAGEHPNAAEFGREVDELLARSPHLSSREKQAFRRQQMAMPRSQWQGVRVYEEPRKPATVLPTLVQAADRMGGGFLRRATELPLPERIASPRELYDLRPRGVLEANVGGATELGGEVAALTSRMNPLNAVGGAASRIAGGVAPKVLAKAPVVLRSAGETVARLTGFLAGYNLAPEAERAIRKSMESGDVLGPTGAMAQSLSLGGVGLALDVAKAVGLSPKYLAQIASSDPAIITEGFRGIGPLAILAGVYRATQLHNEKINRPRSSPFVPLSSRAERLPEVRGGEPLVDVLPGRPGALPPEISRKPLPVGEAQGNVKPQVMVEKRGAEPTSVTLPNRPGTLPPEIGRKPLPVGEAQRNVEPQMMVENRGAEPRSVALPSRPVLPPTEIPKARLPANASEPLVRVGGIRREDNKVLSPVVSGVLDAALLKKGNKDGQQGKTEEAVQRGRDEQPQQHPEGQKPESAEAQEGQQSSEVLAARQEGRSGGTEVMEQPDTGARSAASSAPLLVGKTARQRLSNRAKRITEEGIGVENAPSPPGVPDSSGVAERPSNEPRSWKLPGDGTVQVAAPDIIRTLAELSGSPIRTGLYRGFWRSKQRALGVFKSDVHTIRLGEVDDIQTAAHEAGHALHNRVLKMGLKIPPPAAKQLYQLGHELYGPGHSTALYLKEGIAEYVAQRLFGENPGQRFPEAHQWFEQTFSGDPKIRASLDKAQSQFSAWDRQGADARVESHIVYADGSLRSRISDAYQKLREKLAPRWWTDEFAPLEAGVKRSLAADGKSVSDLAPSKNPAQVAAALKMNAPGTARHFIFESTVNHWGEKTGESLSDVLQPVKNRLRDFTKYAVARRSLLLNGRGIRTGIRPGDAKFVLEKHDSPEFRRALEGVTGFAGRLLDYVQEAGGLSPEARAAIDALNPIYVPFQREFGVETVRIGRGGGTGTGLVDLPSGVKWIRGSGRRVRDPMVEFVTQAERLITLGNKMRIARSIVEFARETPGAGWLAEKVELPKEVTKFTLAEIQNQLQQIGADLGQVDLDSVLSVMDNAQRYRGHENVISLWRDGKRQFWEVDPEIYRAISDMDKDPLSAWLKWMQPAKRGVQLGATGLSLPFGQRNFIRDALTRVIYTASGDRTPYGSVEGMWESLKGGEWAKRFQALGGEMATMMGQDRAEAAKAFKLSLARGGREKGVQLVRHPVEAIRTLLGHIEAAPRLAEFRRVYEQSLKKYGNPRDAAIEAMLAAKDVTVNFTRMGLYIRGANQLIPFFNAKVQGASKFWRVFSGAASGETGRRAAALKATAKAFEYITIPTLLTWWVNKDQEWYRRRKRWERGAYWMFSLDDGKTVVKIPKPFELGYVFGSVPEALLNAAYHRDEESRREINRQVWDTLRAFLPVDPSKKLWQDLTPAALKPIVEVGTNRDFFRDRPIESERDEKKLPEDRYDEWTSETAKAIGKAVGISGRMVERMTGFNRMELSPKNFEQLLGGYTGGMGLSLVRWAEQAAGIKGLTREKSAADMPLVGTFFARPDYQVRPQQVDDFYEQLTQLRQKSESKQINGEETRRLKVSEKIISLAQLKNLRKKISRATGLAKTQLIRQHDRVIYEEAKRRRAMEPAA